MPDSSDNPARPSRFRRAWRALVVGVSALAIVGAIVALVIVYQPMQQRAESIVEAPLTIKFQWPVVMREDGTPDRTRTWLDPLSRAELEELARRTLSNDPFDHDALVRTQEALMATGWFAGPVTVQREDGGVVRIFGPWRTYSAVVRWHDKDYLVADKSERLIREYEPGTSGLKIILGTQFDPPAYGAPWLGGDVEAGLALLEFLRGSTPKVWQQVAAVDVSAYAQTKELIIVTDLGNRIRWGGPPHDFTPGEPSGEVRRRRLEKILADTGRIDANMELLDIRLMENVYRQGSPLDHPEEKP